jgi:hypothetical protein
VEKIVDKRGMKEENKKRKMAILISNIVLKRIRN